MKWFSKGFFLLALIPILAASGCKRINQVPLLSKVVDTRIYDDERDFLLQYDPEGRLTAYGGMCFSYSKNKITLTRCATNHAYFFKEYNASFLITKGRVNQITASYDMVVNEEDSLQIVDKTSDYEYVRDTIFISSYYRLADTGRLLKAVQRKCVLDSQKRIAELITLSEGMNDEVTHRNQTFDYRGNIHCLGNLNILAYAIEVYEPDDFFFFYLNIGEIFNPAILPNAIAYNINKGEEMYHVAANYQFHEDNLTQMELLKNEKQLTLRHEFEYYP